MCDKKKRFSRARVCYWRSKESSRLAVYPKMREKVTAREINCRKRPVTRRIDQLSVRIYQENCVGLRETPCSIHQILAPSSAGEHLLELLSGIYARGECSVLYLVKNEIDPCNVLDVSAAKAAARLRISSV